MKVSSSSADAKVTTIAVRERNAIVEERARVARQRQQPCRSLLHAPRRRLRRPMPGEGRGPRAREAAGAAAVPAGEALVRAPRRRDWR